MKRFGVGIFDLHTRRILPPEYETDSYFDAWLHRELIGWREVWKWVRGKPVGHEYIVERTTPTSAA